MEKLVYLALETPSRELRAKTLLATELLNRGYRVVFGDHGALQKKFAPKFASGIYYDKDFMRPQAEIWRPIKENGCKLYALDEEGVIYETRTLYQQMRIGLESISMLDGVFTWGPDQFDMIKETYPDMDKKGHITGNPRADVLGKNTEIYFGSDAQKYREKYGPYILINSSFSHTRTAERLKSLCGDFPKESEEFYLARQEFQEKLAYAFIEGVAEFAKKTPYNVVVRPHPNRNAFVQEFFDAMGDLPNVHIIRSGDSNAWIYGSEMMIHGGCSTAYEAYDAGRVSVLYQPIYEEKFDSPFPNLLSEKTTNPDELLATVNKYMDCPEERSTFFTEEKEAMLRDRVAHPNGKLAVQNIVDVLDENDFDVDVSMIPSQKTIRTVAKIYRGKWRRFYRRKMQDKKEYIYPSEVKGLIKTAQKALNASFDIKIKELDYNVFLLERK